MRKLHWFLVLLMCYSCKKENVLIEKPSYGDVISSFAYAEKGEKYYALKVDGVIIIDSLPANGNNRVAKYTLSAGSGQHMIELIDLEQNQVVIDSTMELKARETLKFIQLPGQPVQFYGAIDAGEAPADGFRKLQFYYRNENLPDSIKVKLYLLNAAEYPIVPVLRMESQVIKKGAFSDYYLMDAKYDPAMEAFGFEIIDAATGDIVQGIDLNGFVYGIFLSSDYKFETHSFNSYFDPNYGVDIFNNHLLFGNN